MRNSFREDPTNIEKQIYLNLAVPYLMKKFVYDR